MVIELIQGLLQHNLYGVFPSENSHTEWFMIVPSDCYDATELFTI